MNAQPNLTSKRLLLRPLQSSDASTVQTLAGDYRIAAMTESIPHPYEYRMATSWIASLTPGWEKQTHATFAICSKPTQILIGCCGLIINRKHNRGTLGYWMGVEHWGQGYCTEAARELLHFGFTGLHLHRIEAQHLTKNPASGAVMQKIGMTHNATMKEYVLKEGSYEDMELYAILADEFPLD